MRHPDATRYETWLADELHLVERAGTLGDEKWRAIRSLLGVLYQCEEAERAHDLGYYAHRDASPEGRTMGGLMYGRGLVVHKQAEVKQAMLVSAEAFIVVEGELRPAEMFISVSGELKPAKAMMSVTAWPKLAVLPAPGRPERNGRDVMYDDHVAEKPIVRPFREAIDYLTRQRT